jgi:hypothetical protein
MFILLRSVMLIFIMFSTPIVMGVVVGIATERAGIRIALAIVVVWFL